MPADDVARDGDCPFCGIEQARLIAEDPLAFAVRDLFPVSPGHTLVMPRRHVADWWHATSGERRALAGLVDSVKADIDREYRPAGYNVGFNDGRAAGQTVFHLHIHVIPRYRGDVPDPRGGIRHVRPDLANHLSPSYDASTPVASGVEHGLRQAVDSAALIQRVMALLDEGRRSATYKPALLMALVDLAVERGDGPAPLRIPLSDVADRVLESYWPQTRPYPEVAGPLRQATTRTSRVVVAVERLRRASAAAAGTPIGPVRRGHPDDYLRARRTVERALAMQPIPRLQRPGTGNATTAYPRFLYDDAGFATERGWIGPGKEPEIVLRAGVADALARNAAVLRMAAQDVWAREVAALNALDVRGQHLRSFLFGADRANLSAVSDGLRDIGQRHCFWCHRPLTAGVEVDHVIPWSHYPADELFNLVLTDRSCNNDKRDRLVAGDHIVAWSQREQAELRDLADGLHWDFDPTRSGRMARSAYRHLADGMRLWHGTGELCLYDGQQRAEVDAARTRLLTG